jgi:hypothetical protein
MDLLTDHLAEARSAYQRRDWSASRAAFVRADGVGPLAVDDVDAFATATWRLGHANEAVRLAERVYVLLVRTDPAAASTAALDIALKWLTRGDVNVCRIWMDRSRRLLTGPGDRYLGYLDAVVAVRTRQPVVVRDVDDSGPVALSWIVQALDAFHGGRGDMGHALVGRAIPAVESGEVPVEWAGDVYAMLLHLSLALADPSGTTQWTDSMKRWCDTHDAPLYHRVRHVYLTTSERELLTEGSAMEGVHALAAGAAFGRLAEMRRLRGDADGAAAAFAKARRHGVG